jgi:Phospholipase_D-nuclease N-terminal
MNGTDPTHLIVLSVVIIGWLTFWVSAVVSIMGRPTVSGTERGVWVALAIIFPFVGPLAWFVWGRMRHRPRLP